MADALFSTAITVHTQQQERFPPPQLLLFLWVACDVAGPLLTVRMRVCVCTGLVSRLDRWFSCTQQQRRKRGRARKLKSEILHGNFKRAAFTSCCYCCRPRLYGGNCCIRTCMTCKCNSCSVASHQQRLRLARVTPFHPAPRSVETAVVPPQRTYRAVVDK